MALIIIRHGETALNAVRVMQPKDTPLSDRGQAQALALARRLCARDVSAILCSDLERAKMTSAPVAAALGLPVEYTSLLRERDFGDLLGTPYRDLPLDVFAADYIPPQGESWEKFHERVGEAFSRIQERAAGLSNDVVVITHGLVCRTLVTVHGWTPPGLKAPAVWYNTGVSIMAASRPHIVELINCVRHLSPDLGPQGLSGL